MLILLEWVIIAAVFVSLLTSLYLVVRHFHHKWKWQDAVNENAIRRAVLDEMDVQWEVSPDGYVRAVKRSERGHAGIH